MKTIQEMIAVMQAFAEGKDIQLRHLNYSEYYDCTKPGWNWDSYDYRVKEEPKQPEYIPFSFEDAEFLIGKTIIHNSGQEIRIITNCNYITVEGICYTVLLKEYTFLDGSPCGKLKHS